MAALPPSLAERQLKLQRRKAVRPLREMLNGTYFGVRLPWIGTRTVLITLGDCWTREIAWEDCADREVVARLQRELVGDVEAWVAEAAGGAVLP